MMRPSIFKLSQGNLCIIFVLVGACCAQVTIDDPALLEQPIHEIQVIGNQITQAEVILREMKIKPGMVVSKHALERDLLHVRSLDIFNRVEFILHRTPEGSVLLIKVTEEWYIFPLPYWNLTDQKPPQLIYGFRYLQKNFRGRAESLSGSLWGGGDRGFLFSHVNPWMKSTPALSRSISVYQTTTTSRNLAVRNLNLEQRQSVAEVIIGKRWNVEFSSQLGARFRLIQAENPQQLATKGAVDQILETNVGMIWDQRDLWQFPRRGFYGASRFYQGWMLNTNQRFNRLTGDLRFYIPYKSISFCSRFAWQPGWGEIPPYDWYMIDDTSPIRSFRLCDEGKSMFFMSYEIRLELYSLHYFTWNQAPFFKQYFTNLRYGLAAELFIDSGDAYNSSSTLTTNSLMWGYGLGLLWRVPYVDVIRLECSWNPEHSIREVLFSWKVGVSF